MEGSEDLALFLKLFFQNSFCLLFLLGAAIATQFSQIVRIYFVWEMGEQWT